MCDAEEDAAKAGANSYHVYGKSGWRELNKETLQVGGRDARLMVVQGDQLVLLEPELAARVLNTGEGLQYVRVSTSERKTTSVFRAKKKKKNNGVSKRLEPLLQELNSRMGLLTKVMMQQWMKISNATITEIPEKQKSLPQEPSHAGSVVVAAEVHTGPGKTNAESHKLARNRQMTPELQNSERRRKRKESKIYYELSDEYLTDSSAVDQGRAETPERASTKRKKPSPRRASKRLKSNSSDGTISLSQAVISESESSNHSPKKNHNKIDKKNKNANKNNETDSSLEFVKRPPRTRSVKVSDQQQEQKTNILRKQNSGVSDVKRKATYEVPSSLLSSPRRKNLQKVVQEVIEKQSDDANRTDSSDNESSNDKQNKLHNKKDIKTLNTSKHPNEKDDSYSPDSESSNDSVEKYHRKPDQKSKESDNETDSSLQFVKRPTRRRSVKVIAQPQEEKLSILRTRHSGVSNDKRKITAKSKLNNESNSYSESSDDVRKKTQKKEDKKKNKGNTKTSKSAHKSYESDSSNSDIVHNAPNKHNRKTDRKNKENDNINETDSSLEVARPTRKRSGKVNDQQQKRKSSVLQTRNSGISDDKRKESYEIPSSSLTSPRHKSAQRTVREAIAEESDDEISQRNDKKKSQLDLTQGGNSSGYNHVKNRVYSMQEDRIILDHILKQQNHKLVKGTLMWKDLQRGFFALANQARTWQSLKNRYLKYILPNLQYYGLPYDKERLLRAGAYTGEIKKKNPKENSIFKVQPVVSASNVLRHKRERDQARSQNDESQSSASKTDKPIQSSIKTRKSGEIPRPTERKPERRGPTSSTPKNSPTKKSPTYSELTRKFVKRAPLLGSSSDDSGADKEYRSPTRAGARKLYNAKV